MPAPACSMPASWRLASPLFRENPDERPRACRAADMLREGYVAATAKAVTAAGTACGPGDA